MKDKDCDWIYYNHALIPARGPHEEVNTEELIEKDIWKKNGRHALFARWTTDFDCKKVTEWWYCIKDTPFDISQLKAKRRYEINKGKKNFSVKRIDPLDYPEELFQVQIQAFEAYPVRKRPTVEHDSFINGLRDWKTKWVYGAFDRESDKLCGYAYLSVYEEYAEFNVLKTMPSEEKKGLNAAIVAQICEEFQSKLEGNYYISDGSRSIIHETAFQDYLEKYFGFRKAYCRLHLQFRGLIGLVVRVLYPFRKLIARMKHINLFEQISVVLWMREISISQE